MHSEFSALAAWGKKLFRNLVLLHWMLLYLFLDGRGENRLLEGGWVSLMIAAALQIHIGQHLQYNPAGRF